MWWFLMFYHIITAINIIVENFLILLMMRVNLHEVEKWFFKDFLIFVSFRNGTTNRHEIKKISKEF